MVTIRPETTADIAPRERLLDRAFGKSRRRKTSERLREGRVPAEGLAFTAVDAKGKLIGIASGAYSSFFIAAPLLSILKSREPEYRGRQGSDELPAFILGRDPQPATAVAVAAGSAVAPAVAAETSAGVDTEMDDGPPAPPPSTDAPTTGSGPDEAAIEAARRRREERRGKRGRR